MVKLSPRDQQGIVGVLTRIYEEIRQIEIQFGVIVGDGDMRPRVEYFQDAIRAFSMGNLQDHDPGGRLSVEFLAYDVAQLRYLVGNPMALIRTAPKAHSPHAHVIPEAAKKRALAPHTPPERQMREHLSELYQHYAVLFAGLLKPFADRNHQSRSEEHDQEVEMVHALLDRVTDVAAGKEPRDLDALIAAVTDPALRQALTAARHAKQARAAKAANMQKLLKDAKSRADREIAGLEAAHMAYVMAQLGIYEDGRDVVKKLAARGMNLAGNFVEASLAEAKRDLGR